MSQHSNQNFNQVPTNYLHQTVIPNSFQHLSERLANKGLRLYCSENNNFFPNSSDRSRNEFGMTFLAMSWKFIAWTLFSQTSSAKYVEKTSSNVGCVVLTHHKDKKINCTLQSLLKFISLKLYRSKGIPYVSNKYICIELNNCAVFENVFWK